MNHNIYLLVPLLLPAAGALALGLPLIRGAQPRRHFLAALLALEIIFTTLALGMNGGCTLLRLGVFELAVASDNVSKLFSLLFAGLFMAAGVFGFEYLEDGETPAYDVFFLLTLASLMGLCFAANLYTFYLFYEMMTLCSAPLVLHERTGPAIRAAVKYLGYSLFGAALALFGCFVLAQYATTLSFRAGGVLDGTAAGHETVLLLAAFAMLLGFGGKAGLMPLHDWLPTAHPEAPAPASAVLSGVITKAGVLGMLRTAYYLFGSRFLAGSWVQAALLALALATVFCGSMLAYKEKLLKKRLAWSTVSQVSYIIFGLMLLNTTAFVGALLQVVFHAVCKVCLFLCVGAFICKTGRTRADELTGIGRQMPLVLLCFAVGGLSLVGIPPFAGFVSKWYLATGGLAQLPRWGWLGAAVLLVSALLTAGYLLVPVARGFFPGKDFEPDARVRTGLCIQAPVACLAAALLVLGLFPADLIRLIRSIAVTIL